MKAKVLRQKAIKGFLPTTYAVFDGELLLKIFVNKAEAEQFAADYNSSVSLDSPHPIPLQ